MATLVNLPKDYPQGSLLRLGTSLNWELHQPLPNLLVPLPLVSPLKWRHNPTKGSTQFRRHRVPMDTSSRLSLVCQASLTHRSSSNNNNNNRGHSSEN